MRPAASERLDQGARHHVALQLVIDAVADDERVGARGRAQHRRSESRSQGSRPRCTSALAGCDPRPVGGAPTPEAGSGAVRYAVAWWPR
jgi:hypothetical protein